PEHQQRRIRLLQRHVQPRVRCAARVLWPDVLPGHPARLLRIMLMTTTKLFASRRLMLMVGVLLLGSLTLASCDIQGQAGVTGPAGVSMTIVDLKGYEPDSVDISAGATVTFGWNGTNSRQHNFTFSDQSIVSSPTQLYGTYQWTFVNPGVFRFYCTVHGA